MTSLSVDAARALGPAEGVSSPTRRLRSMPTLVEALLTLAAIALLLPAYMVLADGCSGRDQRFADPGFRLEGLPAASLPAACAAVGAQAEPALGERLCSLRSATTASPADTSMRWPPAVAAALAQVARTFGEPLHKASALAESLRRQQREGLGELRALSDAIAALEADTRPLVERFQLTLPDIAVPAPLHCAAQRIEAAIDDSGQPAEARANATLLLAAALDGHSSVGVLAGAATLPSTTAPAGCGAMALADTLGAAATVMADARQSVLNARKNEAMRELLGSAGWQWAGAMLIGWLLLICSRSRMAPMLGAGLALALWTLAAWVACVPWPLSSGSFAGRAFEPARVAAQAWTAPANFVLVLASMAAMLLLWGAAARAPRTAYPRQAASSRIGYPGLVLATGLGWLLLLDLSATGHVGNRYLALYHQGHLWLGLLCLSLLLFIRQPLARALSALLSLAGELASRARIRIGFWRWFAALALVLIGAATVLALGLSNMRQLTSELGRIWLIVGAAWFFFLRGGPLAERLSRSGGSFSSALRYVWPLLFVVGVLIAAMLITRDMGPLLIAGYASGAFLAAAVALWWHERSGSRLGALLLSITLFALWIGLITLALFRLGDIDSVTSARLESLAAPLASNNDQLALVAWFQQAAPSAGFGVGAVPWCGHAPSGACGGVPAQIHSDYTFSAIVGAFGRAMAWVASIGTAFWLHRLIRHHGRVTRGEPRLLRLGADAHGRARLVHDAQALVSWIALAWVVLTLCQLAVTVAGNLAVLPLTGVTFPFVSFGMTSLVVNMAFLALCLNVDLPNARDARDA